MIKSRCILALWLFSAAVTFGQNHSQNRFGLKSYAGKIIAHAADVENTAGAVPVGIEAEFSRLIADTHALKICNCLPTLGFRLAYIDYNNKVLGRGAHAAFFMHYNLLPGRGINPYIGGTAGLGYANNPFHEIKNPENQSYSLRVNGYLRVSTGVEVRLSPRSSLSAEIGFHHISNGGLSQPNRGINQPAVGAGYLFTPYPQEFSAKKLRSKKYREMKGETSMRVFIAGTGNAVDYGKKQRFPVFGAGIISGVNLNNLNRLTLGLEWHYDGGHNQRIKELNLKGNAHRVAMPAGHEFILGKFIFSQQVGIYLYDSARYHDFFYHRWGLSYKHKSGVYIGVNLKAHRHVAEFTDIRVGWFLGR